MFRSRSNHDLLRRKRKRGSFLPILFAIGTLGTASFAYTYWNAEAAPALSAARMMAPAGVIIPEEPQAPAIEDAPAEAKEPTKTPLASPTKFANAAASFQGELQPNESVFLALQQKNVPQGAIHDVVTALSKEVDFRRSRPGDHWSVDVNAAGIITKMTYTSGPLDMVTATRAAHGKYVISKADVETQNHQEIITGTIESSLWDAFDKAGVSPAVIQAFTQTFMYTLDFNEDTQTGDRFSAIYEAVYLDGKKLHDGKLIAAKYAGQAGTFYAFANTDKDGNTSYYDAGGDSLKRQFLKTPLPLTRVTSKFGRRFHPVLKTMRMHAGVDYTAPVGTPVFAAADGTVIYAGRKGANGNLVSIKHSGGYITHYAHLSKIQPSIRVGSRVRQRDIIARSGNTGRSTGPHLHYGMTLNGAPINPLTVDFTRGEPLRGNAREAFKQQAASLKLKLDN